MNTIHKLIIIGSGPAGLTAGIYAGRAHLQPLMFAGPKPGGQLMGTTMIENWPGSLDITGPQLMITMTEQAKKFGTIINDEIVTAIDTTQRPFTITTNTGAQYQTHALIYATGVTPNKLGCPGEEKYWGKGVSTCAVCDGAFYHKKNVVVVGGGDSAMESASFLDKFENNITIVHIKDAFTASHVMQDRIKDKPHITKIFSSTVTEIVGDGQKITGVKIKNLLDNSEQEVACDGVFLAIGAKPNSQLVAGTIDLHSYGHIKVIDHVKTNVPGLFAAGDVHDMHYRQAIVSAGFGCMAALEAERYLSTQK
ncbi:thioredoxin-disulfide reductase [bacterium]|nr:thioredoxin-disulfide reductase [bacterium]